MPAPLTSRQKSQIIDQFMDMTSTMDRPQAQRMLKNADYKIQKALDNFFSSPRQDDGTLDKMFDGIHDASRDPDKNTIEMESMQLYVDSMGLSLEKAEFFVLLHIVKSPGFGTITREGFVNGWKETTATHTKEGHRRYIRERVAQLQDPTVFKEVYKYAFTAGKDVDQKALDKDRAIAFWDLFFDDLKPWRANDGTDLLALWKQFLEGWTRSVNKDMWNQTLEFANKSMEDPSLGFWSEDSAWPGVIDDFVAWYREQGRSPASSGMEVD